MISAFSFAVFSLAACSDYDLHRTGDEMVYAPAMKLAPSVLSYGDLPEGESSVQTFTIENVGNAALEIDNVTLDAPGAFTLVPNELVPGTIQPEDAVSVDVVYTSAGETDLQGWAVVNGNDPTHSEGQVELLAGSSYPEVRWDPNPYDFGNTALGASARATISLMNVGGAPVVVDDVYTDGAPFEAWLDLALPLTLDAGDSVDVTVEFTPTDAGSVSGEIWAVHDGPTGADMGVLQGSAAASGPVAVCYASPDETEPLREITWVGSDSYDPDGLGITAHVWTLVTQPTGSTAAISPAGGSDRDFTPDLAGTYQAELVVTNSAGVDSDPCTADLEVIPGEDLWIEMYWTLSKDDMDLHLVRDAGSLRSDNDCYYANCVPSGGGFGSGGLDWGVRGSDIDDPSLDLDDITNTGPENINVSEPEETDFAIYVHDYTGSNGMSGDPSGSNSVTVKVYMGGALEWEATKGISGDGSYTKFAVIDWATGNITSF
jgi:hypothetical protein